MTPGDGAGEHAWQDVVGAVGLVQSLAPIFVESARYVGTRDSIHTNDANRLEDRMAQMAHGRLVRRRLPRELPLDILRREPRQCRAGSGQRDGRTVAPLARQEREHCGARLAGCRRP